LGGGVNDVVRGQKLLATKSYDDQYFHEELAREMREESSLEITNIVNICPRFRATPREATTNNKHGIPTHYIFLEYLCEFAAGTATPGDDIAQLQWVDKDTLFEVSLTPPSYEMYRELGFIKPRCKTE
jgi:hypothetical protein